MKKLLTLIFIIFLATVSISTSYFKYQDVNTENYINIGKLNTGFDDISMFTYVSSGPALTLGIEIINPYRMFYEWTKKLEDFPYHNWSNDRKNEIVDAIKNNNGIISTSNTNFSKSNDSKYLNKSNVRFDGNIETTFTNNKGLHLFVAICNNAHSIKNPKKLNIQNEKNLYVEANVDFQGNISKNIWRTAHKSKVDLYNNRYYATTAYTYDNQTNRYKQLKRGSWYFYNDADLIIVDLGTTGHIEDVRSNWIFIPNKERVLHKLVYKLEYNKDKNAKIIKADYTVTFSPSWDSNKVLKRSINLN